MSIRAATLLLALSFTVAPSASALAEDANDSVLRTVEEMNAAWMDQDLDLCLSYFTDDTDFENSFGWTVRGREKMGAFLAWLFDRYPKDDRVEIRQSFTVDRLEGEIAWVEGGRRVVPPGDDPPDLRYRLSYLLVKEGENWRIATTRTWQPRAAREAPDMVEAGRFAEVIKAPESD